MTPTLTNIQNNVTFDGRSVHYSKRKLDGQYEVVGRAEVDGVWRYVTLDIQPSRTKALEVVRFLRGHANA